MKRDKILGALFGLTFGLFGVALIAMGRRPCPCTHTCLAPGDYCCQCRHEVHLAANCEGTVKA